MSEGERERQSRVSEGERESGVSEGERESRVSEGESMNVCTWNAMYTVSFAHSTCVRGSSRLARCRNSDT